MKACFCFYPLLFLIQGNEMEIICSMLKMMMLVSKERKYNYLHVSFIVSLIYIPILLNNT